MITLFNKTVSYTVVTLGLVSFLGGCARNISSDTYHDMAVGETAYTYTGMIINARSVKVSAEQLGDNVMGGLIGGAVGGIAGNQFGKGHGNTAATVGGALAGLLAGALIENELKEQDGIEYIVKLDDGEIRTVVQGPQPILAAGQRVFLMVSHKGRSRLIVDNSPVASAAQSFEDKNYKKKYKKLKEQQKNQQINRLSDRFDDRPTLRQTRRVRESVIEEYPLEDDIDISSYDRPRDDYPL